MIYKNDLTTLAEISSQFTEYSKELNHFDRDEVSLSLISNDSIYIGLYKPFKSLYIEILSGNLEDSSMSINYSNGTDFNNSPSYLIDETNNFKQSGFINFERPSDWVAQTINNDNLYWLKLSFSDTTNLTLKGINIVFCNDHELRKEIPTLDKYLSANESSFINIHSTVRDDIVQALRSQGKIKESQSRQLEQVTKWDLLDINEVYIAAKYFALEKVFFQASDSVGDKWEMRQAWASQEGNKAFNLLYMSLDSDDDGLVDSNERLKRQSINVERI
jgi:hypothetical protein